MIEIERINEAYEEITEQFDALIMDTELRNDTIGFFFELGLANGMVLMAKILGAFGECEEEVLNYYVERIATIECDYVNTNSEIQYVDDNSAVN